MENIEQKIPVKTDDYDQDFLLAYELLREQVAAGNALTTELAKALGELTRAVRKYGHAGTHPDQAEPRK